jgi:hypothetical protein
MSAVALAASCLLVRIGRMTFVSQLRTGVLRPYAGMANAAIEVHPLSVAKVLESYAARLGWNHHPKVICRVTGYLAGQPHGRKD